MINRRLYAGLKLGRLLLTIGIGACVISAVAVKGETPILPKPILPKGLEPYVDAGRLAAAARTTASLLRAATLTPNAPPAYEGDYVDAEYPKRRWDEQRKEFVTDRSPCESNLEAMAIHRGWAWIAIGHNVFGRTIEGRDVEGPKFLGGRPSSQSIDLDITRHGRSVLLRAVKLSAIADALQHIIEQSRPAVAVRAEVAAFLRTLLAFRSHHDRLVSHGEYV